MNIINLIYKSRNVLKEVLSPEWNTGEIKDLSEDEIRELYISKKKENKIAFGQASNCNITLKHNKLNNHNLHIIYYNFSDIGQSPIKVTKICSDKIMTLYQDEIIKDTDNLLVIIQSPISDNLLKSFENLIIKNSNVQLDGELKEQNDALSISERYESSYFKNIHINSIHDLSFNKLKHKYVPECRIIKNKEEKNNIIKKCNCTLKQLPIQLWIDPISQLLLVSVEDIIEYKRKTETGGENIYYRLCRNSGI